MNLRITLITILALAAAAAQGETTAFVNVNLLPMTSESVLTGRTLIVEDGRITVIGLVDEVMVPGDALVVDGTDRFLLPGLAEMHRTCAGRRVGEPAAHPATLCGQRRYHGSRHAWTTITFAVASRHSKRRSPRAATLYLRAVLQWAQRDQPCRCSADGRRPAGRGLRLFENPTRD